MINALIGKDILKHATVETTSTITNIHNSQKEENEKIIITYDDGGVREQKGYSAIQSLTTTDSNIDVASKISSVDIFANFMDSKEEVVIVDTPGLNGILDNHRYKMVEEVKNSHVCMHVFQKNRITNIDRESIKFLLKYQNRFIFVQNFIDELKRTEGEPVESKIKVIQTELKNIEGEVKEEIEYEIIGVSALKGLVSKNKNIEKLYSDDSEILTDSKRDNIKEYINKSTAKIN